MKLDTLNLQKDILEKLEFNQVYSIEKLKEMTRLELKELGFTYGEINLIAIKLQLNGFDLSRKKSSK